MHEAVFGLAAASLQDFQLSGVTKQATAADETPREAAVGSLAGWLRETPARTGDRDGS